MKRKLMALLLAAAMTAGLLPGTALAADNSAPDQKMKVTLSEQYLFAGANDEWYAEESYRASPVVIDLDGDGTLEILNAAYSLSVMDAATGATKWQINAGRDRSSNPPFDKTSKANVTPGQVFCDFEVQDIDGDGKLEIVIGYGEGTISVLDDQGYFKPGWPQKPVSIYTNKPITDSIRSLAVGDLNGDGKMEIVVAAGVADNDETYGVNEGSASVWVYDCYGNLVDGWPQLDPSQDGTQQTEFEDRDKTAYSAGVYGNGIALGDLDGDGLPEIIVPTDSSFIDAYNYDGTMVRASEIYSDQYGDRYWGKIALWEDYAEEIAHKNEGWGWPYELDSREHTYRAELAHAGTVYTDVDGDGTYEIVVTALMMDRTTYVTQGNNTSTIADSKYMTAFILNQDRSRYVNEELGFDWTSVPNELTSEISGPLKQKDAGSVAGNVFSVPVCSDIDGDGYQEILFNSFDGKLHCFGLDKSEWCFTLPKNTDTIYEYATPPVCVDLDGDNKQEIIFASWTDCEDENKHGTAVNGGSTGVNGALYVLSYDGELLASMDLHNGYCKYEDRLDLTAGFSNGVMGSPVVEDIDGDGKLEILLNTTYYALCAYEITVGAGGAATTPDIVFSDVANSDYFAGPVYWAVENSLAAGTGDGKFSPNSTCNHAEIITFLWRAAGKRAPSTYDVSAPVDQNQWYTVPVLWAASKGMIKDDFDPYAPCTRLEAAVYIWQVCRGPGGITACKFSDANPDILGWGTDELLGVSWAAQNGITTGYDDGTFRPNQVCERGHIITFLYRAYVEPYSG